MLDWWDEDYSLPYTELLSPAIIGCEGGNAPSFLGTGCCIFFIGGLCAIHPVKPIECRNGCVKEDCDPELHLKVATMWREYHDNKTEKAEKAGIL